MLVLMAFGPNLTDTSSSLLLKDDASEHHVEYRRYYQYIHCFHPCSHDVKKIANCGGVRITIYSPNLVPQRTGSELEIMSAAENGPRHHPVATVKPATSPAQITLSSSPGLPSEAQKPSPEV